MNPAEQQSSTGLPANVAAALAYVLGPLTGLLFLVLEKDRRYVRYHAAHSVAVVGWIVAILANLVFALATFALWIYLIVQAIRGNEVEMPIVGKYARQYVSPAAI